MILRVMEGVACLPLTFCGLAWGGGIEQPGRLEVGGDLHDLLVGTAEARSLIGGAKLRPRAGALRVDSNAG
jgi:hypothetical protein